MYILKWKCITKDKSWQAIDMIDQEKNPPNIIIRIKKKVKCDVEILKTPRGYYEQFYVNKF